MKKEKKEDVEIIQPPTEEKSEQQQKAEEYYDQLIRLKAEFENYRKRVEKEKPQLVEFGKISFIHKLLPLYDITVKAHEHLNLCAQKDGENGEVKELCKGLDMIFNEFRRLFSSEGIEVMEVLGKPYDPMAHEVMAMLDAGKDKEGIVVEEVQRGFTINGKPLRHAKVCVGKEVKENLSQEDKEEKKEE